MTVKYKADSKTVVFVKNWDQTKVSAAAMLFVYGTLPEPDSVAPDSFSQALTMAQQEARTTLEAIALGNDPEDTEKAAAAFTSCLQKINLRLREASEFLGQGIYMGGTVLYGSAQQMFGFAFGNGAIYTWNGSSLELLSAAPPSDNLIRDALGGKEFWIGECLQITGDSTVIAATGFFLDQHSVEKAISESSQDPACDQLYALLARSWVAPHGVMQVSFR